MIPSKIRNKILLSSFLQFFGKILNLIIGFLMIKIISSALGLEEFGPFKIMDEYALFLSAMANLGVFGTMIKIFTNDSKNKNVFLNAILMRALSAGIIFLAGCLGLLIYGQSNVFILGVGFLLCAYFLDQISSVCAACFQARYRMDLPLIISIASKCTELFFLYFLLQNGFGIAALFISTILAAALNCSLGILLILKNSNKNPFRPDIKLMCNLLISALPFGAINIINNLYYRFLPSFIIAKTLSAAAFGAYGIMLSAVNTSALISTYIMLSALPALHGAIKENKKDLAKNLYSTLQKGIGALAFACLIFGNLLGTFLLEMLTGYEFSAHIPAFTLAFLLMTSAISYFYDLRLISLMALNLEKWQLKIEIPAMLISGIFFLFALQADTTDKSLALSLIGAMSGMLFIVITGGAKIRTSLKSAYLLKDRNVGV